MASVLLPSSLAVFSSNKHLCRTSSGIPYIISTDNSVLSVLKGNSTTPTSFTAQDTGNSPSYTNFIPPQGVIDSNDIIHIVYYLVNGMNNEYRYVQFDCSTDTYGTSELINTTNAPNHQYINIAIDSNDIPHVALAENIRQWEIVITELVITIE